MRIATWNINSVRIRLELLTNFVNNYNPDIICLQEIKCADDLFPYDAVKKMGYEYIYVRGEKSYNGVAILSRLPLTLLPHQNWAGKTDSRHIAAMLGDGTVIHNFYVPAGGDTPDPDENEKFKHKLDFLDELTRWFADKKGTDDKMILLGDLNIARLPEDVWSHKQLLKIVSYTPIEREKLENMRASCDWLDAVRHARPVPEILYSWWSYRSRDWRLNNRGRRLDHIWVSNNLKTNVQSVEIATEMRGAEKPSDHVPILLDLAI